MINKVELIKKDEFLTSEWSGGTTTEIAIYPKDSIYGEKNFTWRLSSAKVEMEESNFTSLPGINRIIMVLEGRLKLEHIGHHECTLEPFQQDSFSGSWETKSYGKVVDFNLMMNHQCDGKLEPIVIKKDEKKRIILKANEKYQKRTQTIYCVSGEVKIYILNGETLYLNQGDAALLTIGNFQELEYAISNENSNISRLVKADIIYGWPI